MGLLQGILNYFTPKEDNIQQVKVGRNDLCWCGSGKKYKKCHLDEDGRKYSEKLAACCTTKS